MKNAKIWFGVNHFNWQFGQPEPQFSIHTTRPYALRYSLDLPCRSLEITGKQLGVAGIVNPRGELIGVITDGDLRRALEHYPDLLERSAAEIMTRDPKKIVRGALAAKALHLMEQFSITSLFVYAGGEEHFPVGIIHMHDLIKAGLQ